MPLSAKLIALTGAALIGSQALAQDRSEPLPGDDVTVYAPVEESGGTTVYEPAAEAGTGPDVDDIATGVLREPRSDPVERAEAPSLNQWNYEGLYAEGWSGEGMLDAAVYGPLGERIGDVENIVVGADGRIQGIIAEVGGFLDIGDTHVAVPWGQVDIAPAMDRVTVPVTRETADSFGAGRVFGDGSHLTASDLAAGRPRIVDDDPDTGPRLWMVSELLNDPVATASGVGYGYVDDVLFTRAGEVAAIIVVNPDTGWVSPYALPWHGYARGWHPGLDYYPLPYDPADLAGLEMFDYERLDGGLAAME